MPRTTILEVTRLERQRRLPRPEHRQPKPPRSSAARPPTSSPTSSPATRAPRSTRSGASGRSTTAGRRRPAAYKTGTTNDNRDVHAFGFLAPPKDPNAPGPRGRGLDGQLQQRAQHRHAVARHRRRRCGRGSCPTSARTCPSEVLASPDGPRRVDGRRVQRHEPGPFSTKTVTELFIKGTAPEDTDDFHRAVDDRHGERPALAGRLRRAEEDGRRARLQQRRGDFPQMAATTTAAGRSAPRRARASAAVPRARGPRTSTAAASSRTAGAGAGFSRRPSSARSRRRRR